ncbi:MAG: lactate racemase domain-containing protein, partial [Bacteroidota bacterium]|nr:lactate racemase domain-containing protein [Bacteroidota bacterium]
MLYYSIESEERPLKPEQITEAITLAIESSGGDKPILIIPPDISRFHSGAGIITSIIWNKYRERIRHILPATGTHKPMTANEINRMYKGVPHKLFKVHNCRQDVITLGKIPASYIKEASEGKLTYDWPLQVNKLIPDHAGSLIISVGQVVPHEVTGMANYNKNIFIGCGGYEAINKSHYLSAVYGIERLMGKAINPVRELINRGVNLFAKQLNILYVLTVIGTGSDGMPAMKGLFIGSDNECFSKASSLSARLNIKVIEKPPEKIVTFLSPSEYRSTWLGNKAIYRTRMAIARNGELIIIAPGVKEFGEDKTIDRLIRKYGYLTSDEMIPLVERNADLQENLAAAAHLIHGSPENKFSVRYCTNKMNKYEIKNVGYDYSTIEEIKTEFDP